MLTIIPEEMSKKVGDLQAVILSSTELTEVDGHRENTTSEQNDNHPVSLPEEEIDPRAVYVGKHIQYQPVEPASLTAGELRQIRITLSNGRQYEGFIDSLNEKELQLKSLQAGGELVLPVQLEKISLLEIKM